MAEKLLQHKHCRFCSKAILPDQDFCDEDCTNQHREMLRKKRNQLLMLMAFAIGMMLMTLLLPYL
jgi:predicted nucleic acid-binding Zn ribbon protein